MSRERQGQLHVAAMPFPTPQGTQAVVHAMMQALAEDGRDAHLVTYGDGAGPIAPSYRWHSGGRAPGAPAPRSGPSVRKLASDAALTMKLRSLDRRLCPEFIVAHHVEAAAACLAANTRPFVFFAHTALGPELPTYLPRGGGKLGPLVQFAGHTVDRALCRRADAVAAISPNLRDALEDLAGRAVSYVPPPWRVPAPMTPEERHRGRQDLGLHTDDEVILYAGNLDRYQGVEVALGAAARVAGVRPRAKLVVATASDTEALDLNAMVITAPLPENEEGRRRLYAAADVAVIPRRAPGGLPIKLLDALARGLPVAAPHRAAAGLPLGDSALLVADDDARALAAAISLALSSPRAAKDVAERGRQFIAREHSPARFLTALDSVFLRTP
ncbi:MAG: glycosyltransferase [Deltaproteobacteria bacterium]|nr:glycosyltransferase [Deltaproteobacteria bacterium]